MKSKDLNTWLDAETGRATWLAGQFGIHKTAITLWRDSGVPLDRMTDVVRLTKGAVTIDAMVTHAIKARASSKPSKRTAKV